MNIFEGLTDMSEVELSKQSKQILEVLREEAKRGLLSEEEVKWVQSSMRLKESLGTIGNFVIKTAAFITAATFIMQWWLKR